MKHSDEANNNGKTPRTGGDGLSDASVTPEMENGDLLGDFDPGLPPEERLIIAKVIACPTYKEGCENAGISRGRFYQLMDKPAFNAEFYRQLNLLASYALQRLYVGLDKACEKLVKHIDSRKANISLDASKALIDRMFKIKEMQMTDELRQELERLKDEQLRRED